MAHTDTLPVVSLITYLFQQNPDIDAVSVEFKLFDISAKHSYTASCDDTKDVKPLSGANVRGATPGLIPGPGVVSSIQIPKLC